MTTQPINHITSPVPIQKGHLTSTRTWIVLSLSTIVVSAIMALGYLASSLIDFSWKTIVLVGINTISTLVGAITLRRTRRNKLDSMIVGMMSGFIALSFVAQVAFVQGIGVQSALTYLAFTLIVSTAMIGNRSGTGTILMGLFASAAIAFTSAFSPYITLALPGLNWVFTGLMVVVISLFIFTQLRFFSSAPMQLRLTTTFISITILSLTFVTLVQSEVTIATLSGTTSQSVLTTSRQLALSLDQMIDTDLQSINQAARLDVMARFLEQQAQGLLEARVKDQVETVFSQFQLRESNERIYLSSYALLDINGRNVYDSRPVNIGKNEKDQSYFYQTVETGKPYVSDLLFADENNSYIYYSAPVRNNRREIIGVLRVRYSGMIFQRMLTTYSGLQGIYSQAILVDEIGLRIADTFQTNSVYSTVSSIKPDVRFGYQYNKRLPQGAEKPANSGLDDLSLALANSEIIPTFTLDLDPGSSDNPRPEIGGISSMTKKPWKVIYLQANVDVNSVRNTQINIATVISTLIAVLVGFVSVGLSNLLSAPIQNLTHTAERISQGDLDARAVTRSNDEFGLLGRAFNQMTDQLRSFINELEDRVAQRTSEIARQNENLVYRSRQLQTVADVARSIVSSQELQSLLESVTRLISERFNFYHVGIFLLDENREYAVLRAANSEGGQRMLARNHRLKAGKVGIVGYVSGLGRPRIATDVGEDSVYFNNPDLPLTRSEMALPLTINNEIIGVLDVQSTESNAFSETDIELFTTLADQVAVAIYNNRLYVETTKALEEAQNLHRQYLQQEWSTDLRSRTVHGYLYDSMGVHPLDAQPEEISTGEPHLEEITLSDGSKRIMMVIPIILRGETIGSIRVQDDEERDWTDEEMQTVKDVAQQVGMALEAARLLEKTVHRAEREKKVLEITGKIRSSNDPKEMLEIAAEELKKALGASRALISVRAEQTQSTSPADPAITGRDQ